MTAPKWFPKWFPSGSLILKTGRRGVVVPWFPLPTGNHHSEPVRPVDLAVGPRWFHNQHRQAPWASEGMAC